MADYFTSDHFKLLNKWKDQKRDDSNPEQTRAYDELKKAYDLTEQWAKGVQEQLFPDGFVSIRKRPTNQANNFSHYNWAKIYPQKDSPQQLAYTVGIGATDGFVVKIDTVGLDDWQKDRKAYLNLRGEYNDQSPIISMLPATQGLQMTMPELVKWSVESINKFEMSYEEVASKMKLSIDPNAILKHFQVHADFVQRQPDWPKHVTDLFVRLARCVHDKGFDWYFTYSTNSQLRFGRKEKKVKRGKPIGWLFLRKDGVSVSFQKNGDYPGQDWAEISSEIIEAYEDAVINANQTFGAVLPDYEREGYWPDEYGASEIEDKDDEQVPVDQQVIPFNRIYYGPPGTGKTYKLQQLLLEEYTHDVSSLSKSEQIAELIKDLTWWQVLAASLYDLGGKANVNALVKHDYVQAVIKSRNRSKNINQTIWGTLQQHAPKSSSTVKVENRSSPYIFDKSESSEWFFVGDWKEQCVDILTKVDVIKGGAKKDSEKIQHYEFVTFHQSYGYEEFVEGLRPVLKTDSEGLRYEIRPGAFLNLCARARMNPERKYAMVIDEINRGNISKIFGELITLIEPDKREGAMQAAMVTLPYSGEQFSVPANVDIIGTMNTADRSLALLDTALRRRFEFVPVLPDTRDEDDAPLHGLRVAVGEKIIDIPQMLSAINQRIEALYDRDHCIGHAYFTSLSQIEDKEERAAKLAQIFRNRILPLLEEYFFEDWQKIQLVLADNQKDKPARFVVESQDHEEDLARLFGSDHGLDTYTTKMRYDVQEGALSNPDAYIGIYQTLSP